MVEILLPCASYNSRMIHKSNERVLAKHPHDSHTKSGQQQTWKKQMYVLNVFLGVSYPCVSYKKVLQLGVDPPMVSIHQFNVGLTPPRVGLTLGDKS